MQLAVEVRHPAWFDAPHHKTLQALLASHQMARVMIDTRPIRSLQGDSILKGSVYERLLQARERKPNLPIVTEPTAAFTFLRYIGHPQLEQNAPFLDEWAEVTWRNGCERGGMLMFFATALTKAWIPNCAASCTSASL